MEILLIEGVKVSQDVLYARFECDYEKCKGACCYENLEGVTLLGGQLTTKESKEIISCKNSLKFCIEDVDLRNQFIKTPIVKIGKISFTNTYRGKCVFETPRGCLLKTHRDFKKVPCFCGIYPLDVNDEKVLYIDDLWMSKCAWGWKKGSISGTFLIDFVKDSIIGFYGEDFYNSLKDVQQKLGIV